MLHRAELANESTDRLFAVGNRTQAANFAIWLGYSYGNRLGMDIHAQKS
jgi:hypothetical protein